VCVCACLGVALVRWCPARRVRPVLAAAGRVRPAHAAAGRVLRAAHPALASPALASPALARPELTGWGELVDRPELAGWGELARPRLGGLVHRHRLDGSSCELAHLSVQQVEQLGTVAIGLTGRAVGHVALLLRLERLAGDELALAEVEVVAEALVVELLPHDPLLRLRQSGPLGTERRAIAGLARPAHAAARPARHEL